MGYFLFFMLTDKLLNYKNKLYNENEKENLDNYKTSEYMDSCLIFTYNDDYKEKNF